MNILHLLSWCPNPDDPTLGNFCIRQINALPDCNSIVLSAYEDRNMTSGYEIRDEQNEHHRMVRVHYSTAKKGLFRKMHVIKMYNIGLQYIISKYFTPNLVHVHVAYPIGIIALLWKWRHGFKYILTEHWTIYQPQNADMLRGFMKRAIVKTGNNASAILPVSLDLQHNMERIGIKNKFKVIYNSVDTNIFRLGEPQHNAKKNILHISTLRDEAKNFSGILRTIERLRQQRDDFVLNVIHDYDAPEFKTLVTQHGLSDCIVFHGKKTSKEVADFFAKADFFVLFSNFENLPCVIVEAFASGVPVVSTNVGGITEILSPERGILINQGDEDALLQSMNQMLDHSSEYDREAIRQYAIETFAAKKIGKEIAEEYKKV